MACFQIPGGVESIGGVPSYINNIFGVAKAEGTGLKDMTSNSTSDEEQQFLQTTSTGGQQETTNESQQRLVDAGILETSGHYCGGVEAQKGEAASDVSSLETAVDTLTSDMIIVEQEDSKDLHDDVSVRLNVRHQLQYNYIYNYYIVPLSFERI